MAPLFSLLVLSFGPMSSSVSSSGSPPSTLPTPATLEMSFFLLPYLTHSVGAILLFIAGTLLARFLARTVLIEAVNARLQYARFLSVGVKWLVLVLTAATVLDHLEIGGTVVDLAFGILFGGIVLTLSLAIGLGSRDIVSRSLEKNVDDVIPTDPSAYKPPHNLRDVTAFLSSVAHPALHDFSPLQANNSFHSRKKSLSSAGMRSLLTILLFTATFSASAQVKPHTKPQENLAQRPYMGWSSWSFLRGKVSEENVKAQVDALFAARLSDFGYRYINLDAGWAEGYDEHGIPKTNLIKFPPAWTVSVSISTPRASCSAST